MKVYDILRNWTEKFELAETPSNLGDVSGFMRSLGNYVSNEIACNVGMQLRVTHGIGNELVNNKGKLRKRINKYLWDNFSVQIEPDTLSSMVEERVYEDGIRIHSAKIDTTLNWNPGDFGDPNSCFWTCHNIARYFLKSKDTLALQLYNSSGNGIGRCWLMPYEDSLLMFNSYPSNTYTQKYVDCIVKYLASKNVQVKSYPTRFKNKSPGGKITASGWLYINHGECRVIEEIGSKTRCEVILDVPEPKPEDMDEFISQCSSCERAVYSDRPYTETENIYDKLYDLSSHVYGLNVKQSITDETIYTCERCGEHNIECGRCGRESGKAVRRTDARMRNYVSGNSGDIFEFIQIDGMECYRCIDCILEMSENDNIYYTTSTGKFTGRPAHTLIEIAHNVYKQRNMWSVYQHIDHADKKWICCHVPVNIVDYAPRSWSDNTEVIKLAIPADVPYIDMYDVQDLLKGECYNGNEAIYNTRLIKYIAFMIKNSTYSGYTDYLIGELQTLAERELSYVS